MKIILDYSRETNRVNRFFYQEEAGEIRRGCSTNIEDAGRSHKPKIKMPLEAW